MSYQIIESNREVGAVEPLCRALGISVSGYYAWRSRAPSQHQQADAVLLNAIRAVYQVGRGGMVAPAFMRRCTTRVCAVRASAWLG